MKNKIRIVGATDGKHQIKQVVKGDDVITTIEDIKYTSMESLEWKDVSRWDVIFQKEIDKANRATEGTKPTRAEKLFKELGFKDV